MAALESRADLNTVPNLSHRGDEHIVANPISEVSTASEISALDYERFDLLRNHDRYIQDFCGPFFIPHKRPQATLMAVGQRVFGGAKKNTMILPAGRGCSVTCGWCGGGKLSHKKFHGRSDWFQMTSGRTAALIARSVELGFGGVQACFDPTPKTLDTDRGGSEGEGLRRTHEHVLRGLCCASSRPRGRAGGCLRLGPDLHVTREP